MEKRKSVKKEKSVPKSPGGKYVEGIGRRKTAIARARLVQGKGTITILDKSLDVYFQLPRLQEVVKAPLLALGVLKDFDVSVHVEGGGINAQAEAVRLGIARALVTSDAENKKKLRTLGYMTRDPRMVERKKYGLKKARLSPQWSKR